MDNEKILNCRAMKNNCLQYVSRHIHRLYTLIHCLWTGAPKNPTGRNPEGTSHCITRNWKVNALNRIVSTANLVLEVMCVQYTRKSQLSVDESVIYYLQCLFYVCQQPWWIFEKQSHYFLNKIGAWIILQIFQMIKLFIQVTLQEITG